MRVVTGLLQLYLIYFFSLQRMGKKKKKNSKILEIKSHARHKKAKMR